MSTATKAKKKSDGVKIQPLGDRVVVEREESESKTAGGIVLPDSAKDKPSRGKVIAIGDGRLLDDGSRSKLQVKVGDNVLFTSYALVVFLFFVVVLFLLCVVVFLVVFVFFVFFL